MKKCKWSKEEIDLLEKIFDKYPSFKCYNEYQKQAKKLGYPERSIWSIRWKMRLEFDGCRNIIRTDNFTVKDLSEILGLSKTTIQTWISKKKLHVMREKGMCIISKKSLKSFATKVPSQLAFVERDRLLYLFDDDDTVDKILSLRPLTKKIGKNKRVMDLQTGRVYESLKQAAIELHYSYRQMGKIIKESGNFTFLPD